MKVAFSVLVITSLAALRIASGLRFAAESYEVALGRFG
jgi:hypothetical protein